MSDEGGKKPEPRDHKLAGLWQAYLWFDEIRKMRIRHELRISAIERGASNMDAEFEQEMMEKFELEAMEKFAKKQMRKRGKEAGAIFEWMTARRGISDDLACQFLALVDDIGLSPTVSSLWRFCGLAVIDGKAEIGTRHYNRRLKSLLLGPTLIGDQFIRQRTEPYRQVYDDEKARLYKLYPDPQCNKCNEIAVQKGGSWVCPNGCKFKTGDGFKVRHTPLHIDKMARRKMVKIFLQHVWLLWRLQEGLPVSDPYVVAHLGHAKIVPPPDVDKVW